MPKITHRSQMLVLGVLAVVLVGCAPEPVRLDPAVRAGLKDEAEVQVLGYKATRIFVQTRAGQASSNTAGLGLLGAAIGLGTAAADEQQQAQVRALGLPNPADRVRERFMAGVASELGLTNLKARPEPLPSDELDEVARALGRGLVFDINTFNWGLQPDQGSSSAYVLYYRARARLIRVEDKKVLWLGICSAKRANEPGRRPSWDDFLANQGQLLRQKTDALADHCAGELIDQLQGRGAPGS